MYAVFRFAIRTDLLIRFGQIIASNRFVSETIFYFIHSAQSLYLTAQPMSHDDKSGICYMTATDIQCVPKKTCDHVFDDKLN